MQDLRFSQLCYWRFKSSRTWHRVVGQIIYNISKDRKNLFFRLISFTNFNAQFLYLLTICMLHYNPLHVSNINMPIFSRTNCIITASGIVTLCTVWQMRADCFAVSHPAYCRESDDTRSVIIQFVLLKMGMLMLKTCRGL